MTPALKKKKFLNHKDPPQKGRGKRKRGKEKMEEKRRGGGDGGRRIDRWQGERGGGRNRGKREEGERDGGREGVEQREGAARAQGGGRPPSACASVPWKHFVPAFCPWRASAEQTAIHISIHDICLPLWSPERSLPSTASLAPLPSFLSASKQIAGQMTALFPPFPSENSPPCWPLGAPIKGQAAHGHVGWPGPASVSRSLGPFHRKKERGRRQRWDIN